MVGVRLYEFRVDRVESIDQWGQPCGKNDAHTLLRVVDCTGCERSTFTWHNGYENVEGDEITVDGETFRLHRNTIDAWGGSRWCSSTGATLYDDEQVKRHVRRPMIGHLPVTVHAVLAVNNTQRSFT